MYKLLLFAWNLLPGSAKAIVSSEVIIRDSSMVQKENRVLIKKIASGKEAEGKMSNISLNGLKMSFFNFIRKRKFV